MTIELTDALKRTDKATYEIISGEAILIDSEGEAYYSLNQVGTEFWQMLDGQQTIVQHAATIASKYAVEPSMVEQDLLALAVKMMDDALVAIAA